MVGLYNYDYDRLVISDNFKKTVSGYGDITPTTQYGRILTYLIVSFGYIMYAIPAGIIGTGFALKIREHSKIKHHQKRRQPAAYLIQNAWRLYSGVGNFGFFFEA